MSPAHLLPIALLGGLAGLDTVSFPQAMLSRPIVAATLGLFFFRDKASSPAPCRLSARSRPFP